jgi:DNA-binding MarR family transcriptional regulator
MSVQWLTEAQQRTWRDYLRVERMLPAQLNRELQASSGLSLPEYEVLVYLSESPDGRLRPFQLGEGLQWEQSRLSHQLTRMQRRGLLTREECEKDGRGAFVVITPAGRTAIEAAAPGHVAAVQRLVFSQLGEDEAAAFGQACAKILAALRQIPGSACSADACSADAASGDACSGDAPDPPECGGVAERVTVDE